MRLEYLIEPTSSKIQKSVEDSIELHKSLGSWKPQAHSKKTLEDLIKSNLTVLNGVYFLLCTYNFLA